ncbi:MAG: type IV toxin-antitoxin system AbiEi family antitoxin domain-containing protein [Candidatus Margulisiibacteriota bacterium]
MAKLVNWYDFERKIKGKKLPLFSLVDIQRLFGVSKVAATFLLHRYLKKGAIVRVKRGLYSLPDTLPSELFLANKLYEPSYISLEFALSYHNIIPETVYEITSVTTKTTRQFEALGRVFSYRKIKKEAFAGYSIEQQKGLSFRIADAEKAFVDLNYFRLRSGKKPLDRFVKKKINAGKAARYALGFNNPKLIASIKEALT